MNKRILKPKEMSKLLNVTVKTLQRWDNSGKLKAHRNPSNRRYYYYEQYLAYIGELNNDKGKVVIYTRVSTRNQKDDLKNQKEFLKAFANGRGLIVDEILSDIGSGLNYNRKKWNKLLDEVSEGKISKVIIAHKDRFVRFGFEWFERYLKKNGVELLLVNNEEMSLQEEIINDIISILHVFSCKVYGLRKYKKKIKEDDDL